MTSKIFISLLILGTGVIASSTKSVISRNSGRVGRPSFNNRQMQHTIKFRSEQLTPKNQNISNNVFGNLNLNLKTASNVFLASLLITCALQNVSKIDASVAKINSKPSTDILLPTCPKKSLQLNRQCSLLNTTVCEKLSKKDIEKYIKEEPDAAH